MLEWRDQTLATSRIINRPQTAQVTVNRIGTQPLAFQITLKIINHYRRDFRQRAVLAQIGPEMPSGRPIQIHRTKSPRRTLSLDTASQIIEKTNTSSHNQIQYDISPFKFSSQIYPIPLRISSSPFRNKLQSSPKQTPILSGENSNPFRGNPLFPSSKIMTNPSPSIIPPQ